MRQLITHPCIASKHVVVAHRQQPAQLRSHALCGALPAQHVKRRCVPVRAVSDITNVDQISIDQLDLDDPYAHVEDVMREHDLKFAMPAQTLSQIEPLMESVQALPVLDDDFKVVGLVARKDLDEARADGYFDNSTVVEVMSAPAITVRARAHVGEAAAVLLSNKIHSVPVVDADGRLMGILSRTDIFKSQLVERADQLKALTVDALQAAAPVAAAAGAVAAAPSTAGVPADTSTDATQLPSWTIKYLYDGDCSICRSLKALLERQDGGKGRICFVNIASSAFNSDEHEGISYEEAMESIHAIKANGEILTGPPALLALYDAVGLGWVAKFAALPVFASITEVLYSVVSKYRLQLGGAADALLAAHRMKQVDAGVSHCTDDEEECNAPEW